MVVKFSPPLSSRGYLLDRSPSVAPSPETKSWTGGRQGGGLNLITTVKKSKNRITHPKTSQLQSNVSQRVLGLFLRLKVRLKAEGPNFHLSTSLKWSLKYIKWISNKTWFFSVLKMRRGPKITLYTKEGGVGYHWKFDVLKVQQVCIHPSNRRLMM